MAMNSIRSANLREMLAQGRLEPAVGVLQRQDASTAANALAGVPFAEQEILFRALPVDFAAKLLAHLPYYDAYVLMVIRYSPCSGPGLHHCRFRARSHRLPSGGRCKECWFPSFAARGEDRTQDAVPVETSRENRSALEHELLLFGVAWFSHDGL